MKRALLGFALVCASSVSASAQTANPPMVYPPLVAPLLLAATPPNANSSLLLATLLAISRAQQTNPQAALNASFAYAKSLERYRVGDINAANASALDALATANANAQSVVQPLPAPAYAPPALSRTELYGASAPAIDAEAFLALTRNQLTECAARKSPELHQAQAHYRQAEAANAAHAWQAVRRDSKAAIDACAAAR